MADTDKDGITDDVEQALGTDPKNQDTAAGLSTRVEGLRARLDADVAAGAAMVGQGDILKQAIAAADARVTTIDEQIAQRAAQVTQVRKEADDLDQAAAALEKQGLTSDAQEKREEARIYRAAAEGAQQVVDKQAPQAAAARQEAARAHAELAKLAKDNDVRLDRVNEAETQVDLLEQKVGYLREAEDHAANGVRLHAEADQLRAAGDDEGADRKVAEAAEQEIASQAKRGSADELVVDETKLAAAGVTGPVASLDPTAPGLDPVATSAASGLAASDDVVTGTAEVTSTTEPSGDADTPPAVPAVEEPVADPWATTLTEDPVDPVLADDLGWADESSLPPMDDGSADGDPGTPAADTDDWA